MNIKKLNEELSRLLESIIPADAEMVSEGPGGAAYILEKNLKRGTKYQVYWDLRDGIEQKGGLYKTWEEAYQEIVDDFENFDSWDEILHTCTFYDEVLEEKVAKLFPENYYFTIEENKLFLRKGDDHDSSDYPKIIITRTEKGFDIVFGYSLEKQTISTASEVYDYLQKYINRYILDDPRSVMENEITVEEIQNLPIGTNESKNENLISNRRFRLQRERDKKVKRLFGKQNKYQED